MILVSSCLLGLYAKYDGTITNTASLLLKYSHWGQYIPICPEQQGGLSTPRQPAEIIGGTGAEVLKGDKLVRNALGEDVTAQFIKGAQQALEFTKLVFVNAAILKEQSPSCGKHLIHNGEFVGNLIPGQGVTVALLTNHQIPVYSEQELSEELLLNLLTQSREMGQKQA